MNFKIYLNTHEEWLSFLYEKDLKIKIIISTIKCEIFLFNSSRSKPPSQEKRPQEPLPPANGKAPKISPIPKEPSALP